ARPVRGGHLPAKPHRSRSQGRERAPLAQVPARPAARSPGVARRRAPGRARLGARQHAAPAARTRARGGGLRRGAVRGAAAGRPLVVAGPPGLTALLQHLERAGSLGTGDMEVRVLEQQGNGGEVRIEGSQFLVESRPLAHRVPTYGFRVALPDRAGTLDVARTDAAGIPRGPLLADLKAGRPVTLADGRVVGPEGLVGPRQRGPARAYALDTVPCPSAVELGRGVDALVHEATYED